MADPELPRISAGCLTRQRHLLWFEVRVLLTEVTSSDLTPGIETLDSRRASSLQFSVSLANYM
jgi:hypothetical protein